MSKKQFVESTAKWITVGAIRVQEGYDGYQDGQEIQKNLTPPEEQEIQEVTEQEAKEIIAEYKKIQVYHKSKNNDDLMAISINTGVDTPWDHAFYPILILPNTQYYIGLNWLYDLINNKFNYFFITRKNMLLIGLSEGKYIEESIKNTLNELIEEIKKAKDIFLRMYPEDELLLQEFETTMEQSIIEFIKQIEDNTENKPYYLQKYNYIIKIDYIKSDNNIELSMYKKI